jgi:tetratricopeptide (TPR) repeat protein
VDAVVCLDRRKHRPGNLSDFASGSNATPQFYFEVNWIAAAPSAGFVVCRSVLSDLQNQVILDAPDVAVSAGAALPSVERYTAMHAKVSEGAQLLAQEPVTETAAQSFREELQAALEINPLDPESLLDSAVLSEKLKDYAAAARYRTALTEVRPFDAATYAALGHALVLGADFDAAETPLQRTIELNLRTPQMAEDFARIRLARKDDKAAMPFLEEALQADAKRQDLWFIQAQAAERLRDSLLAIHSLEQGLALGGTHIVEGTSLARLYLATKQKPKASQLARQIVAGLPPDPGVRAEFAGSLDDLQLTNEALMAWRRVLEVQANSGRAHFRIAQILLASGDAAAAEQAANIGLGAAPKFAGLYIVKADALEKEGRLYNARNTLEEGAANVKDAALLARLAATADTSGGLAADAYAVLAEALGSSSAEKVGALERGFAVSLRDGDFKRAESFAAMLESEGRPPVRNLMGTQEQAESGTLIPGGLDALAFAAHAKEGVPPEKFMVEYCRALINQLPEQPTPESKQYVEKIQEHFQRIEALQAFGKREGDRVVITLSADGKDGLRTTEKVLGLLGMKLHNAKGQLEVDRGEKKEQAKKQETASALAIDEVGMQEALKEGKHYEIEIPYEWAAVYPNEKLWRETFYPKEGEAGGIATAMLRMPKVARLYVGLSYLDRKTVSQLLSAVTLKTLEERYADLLHLYAPALAIQGNHAVVPGGTAAEAIWANLAGTSPAEPGPFFRSLLERGNGSLLAFFFTLSQLDRQHQAFFTANLTRTSRFYTFFSQLEENRRSVSTLLYDSAFTKFLRSVPLDGNGHVDFPGSAEVWTVAKGRTSSGTQVAKMMKKVSTAAAPEVEDELLLRLAQTRYKEKVISHTELENFLAVARIEAHRTQPMDEQSALVLAQNYTDFSSTYAYLAEITALGSSDYERFFATVEHFKGHSLLETNLTLGQFHSLIEWICLLRGRHVIDDNGAAKLFRYICERFSAADDRSGYTTASLDSARAILEHCKPAEKTESADDTIRGCLLGANARQESRRSIEFQRVLDLQKVPSLDAMFGIYDGLQRISTKGAGELAAIKKSAEGLPVVELPKNIKVASKEKESVLLYEPAAAQKSVAELAVKFGKKKPNAKEIEKASQELLAELQPQVTLALAGKVYAYFLRSSDLVVSEDPLLLRKHHYFNFDLEIERKQLLQESSFQQSSEGMGSYFVGGFAQFPLAAGKAAAISWKTAGPGGSEVIAAQVAAIRSAAWDRLEESDQRLVSLRIAIAREWIVESIRRPDVFQSLSEETMGLLSLSRRADLLNGIESRNWRKVWDSITLPELFMLGGKYLERFKADPWSSPVTSALRSVVATNDGTRLDILGAIAYHAAGCTHPHLLVDAPYEEYERQQFPEELAERSAEFKLFLAVQADNVGVEPSALANIAEPLASKAFRSAHMSDGRDWRSLLAAYGTIKPKDVKQALEQ